jgi:hypothetical protein
MRCRVVACYLIAPALFAVFGAAALAASPQAPVRPASSAFVPGTGTSIDYVGDDFEDSTWQYIHKHPKSSREQDERVRMPTGGSTNGRWYEGPERGQPDQVEIVPTPAGGLEGSARALLMRTLHSGIPGINTRDVQQDDLIANCTARLRGGIPASERPSCTVRVFLPPADQWENRSGPHFGYRTSASTMTTGKTKGLFSSSRESEVEPYWPGMWIHFRSQGSRGAKADSAYIAVRSNRMGHDFPAREIPLDQFGWWTLGMSYSGEGMVHYYASPGVDELSQADYLTSQFPYGFQARQFRTYFFDVCNQNDGRTWSTPFVVDDPKLFVMNPARVNSIVAQKQSQDAQAAARKANPGKQTANRKTNGRSTRTR